MIRQLGTPTLFLTLSISESNSPELIQFLYKLQYDTKISLTDALLLDDDVKNKLIRDDPVSVVRYIDKRFSEIMRILISPNGPLKKNFVDDFFTRKEFQGRGSVHIHALLWFHDTPQYDSENNSSINEVIQFVDTYISCRDISDNPFLSFQKHKHTMTCSKGRKDKKECRFHYPQYVMRSTQILTPLGSDEIMNCHREHLKKIRELMNVYFKTNVLMNFDDMLNELKLSEQEYLNAIRSSSNKDKLFMKRGTCDVAINNYNETILNLLEANMDIQFVLDPYACAQYIINYISKIDVGVSRLLREAANDFKNNNNQSLRDRLRRYGNIFINGNVMPAQEAVYLVLGIPLCESSREVIFINSSPKNERVRMLKPNKNLTSLDEDSTEIYSDNIFDKYEQRPSELQDICLADFAAMYKSSLKLSCKDDDHLDENDFVNYDCDIDSENYDGIDDNELNIPSMPMKVISKRTKVKIIRYRRYQLQKDPINYYREQVLLFYPWRNEENEIEKSDCKTLYYQNIDIILKKRNTYTIIGDETIDEAMQQAMNDNTNKHNDENITFNKYKIPKSQEVDIFNQSGTEDIAKTFKTRFTKPPITSKEQIFELLDTLNDLQRQIVLHILKCFKTDDLPLKIFISGSAGVGKTRVINCIYQLLSSYFDKMPGEKNDLPIILLCAPSGKAAHLIGGVTLHTAFALPITEFRGQMPQLSPDIANSIRSNLVQLKLLIIDEISMVGANMLMQIDTRLQQIMGKNLPFGGISVLLIGDLHQLPPVKDKVIYSAPNAAPLSELSNISLWEQFEFFELTEIMRQRDDKSFIDALNNLALGKMTEENISLIKSREVSEKDVPQNAIRLCYENVHVDKYNQLKIGLYPGTCYNAIAQDCFVGNAPERFKKKVLKSLRTNNTPKKELKMLKHKIQLKYGIKYMVTSNVDVLDGLVNGSCGVLEHITFSPNTEIPDKLWINFNHPNIGLKQKAPFLHYMRENNIDQRLVPILRMSLQISGNKENRYQIMRAQFPIVPAEAVTIPKLKGKRTAMFV